MDPETQLREVVLELLRVLPDNGSHPHAPCRQWCWDELSGAAQQEVKAARNHANEVLRQQAQKGE